jgi:hypothetical protein
VKKKAEKNLKKVNKKDLKKVKGGVQAQATVCEEFETEYPGGVIDVKTRCHKVKPSRN